MYNPLDYIDKYKRKTEWRLPTISELQQIFDYETGKPKIEGFTISSHYWSSTIRVGGSSHAWTFSLAYGYSYSYDNTYRFNVRCVKDTPDGLIWSESVGPMTWNEAIKYAKDLKGQHTRKIKIKTVNIIDVNDFDELVTATYGRPYRFQQQDGCRDRGSVNIAVPSKYKDYYNTTVPEVVNHKERGVSFDAWLARDPKQKLYNKEGQYTGTLDLWWKRNFYPHVSMVINDLHKRGLLEEGNYSINIDW